MLSRWLALIDPTKKQLRMASLVKKHEKGVNRVSASRLQQIASFLQVTLPFFFDGAPAEPGDSKHWARALLPSYINEFLTSKDGVALARAFAEIPDLKLRRRIVELIEQIADQYRTGDSPDHRPSRPTLPSKSSKITI